MQTQIAKRSIICRQFMSANPKKAVIGTLKSAPWKRTVRNSVPAFETGNGRNFGFADIITYEHCGPPRKLGLV